MSGTAAAIVSAILGFVGSAVVFLAYSLSRTRERLARLEQHVEDLLDRRERPRYDPPIG